MIESGYIQYKISAENSIDEYGNPVIGTETWSDFYPANIEGTKSRVYSTEKGNRYINATYTIILPFIEISDRLTLYDRNKHSLGEFDVLQTQNLPILGELRITV
jgi:hypothetical protein